MEFRGMMGGLYKISEWIMRLAVINVLWIVCSIPFFFLVMTLFVSPDLMANAAYLRQWILLMAIVAPFTLMPASGAMFTVARKWVTGDVDVPLLKTFFRGYKENYKQSMMGGLVLELIGFVLYVNYLFYSGQTGTTKVLAIVFLVFLVMLFAVFLNYLSIMVHFHMRFWQVVKNSLLLTIGHPLSTISLVALNAVILYFSLFKFTVLIPFFMGSLVATVSFFIFYRSFERMREKLQQKQDENGTAQDEDGEDKQADAALVLEGEAGDSSRKNAHHSDEAGHNHP